MQWRELGEKIVDAYGKLSVWVYNNPVEADLIIASVVVGSCAWYWRRQRRLQHKAFRIIRGALMKRKDREKFHLMAFEDAIVDKAMEMVLKGEMSVNEEKEWYEFFAAHFNLAGLVPCYHPKGQRSAIKAIKFRLLIGINRRFVDIPGGKPGEGVSVDKSYKPVLEETDTRRSSSTSRYL